MSDEFNGFTKDVIGKKLPCDTTLNNMKKSELIELLHIAQHNYNVLIQFYTNAVNVNIGVLEDHDKKIRDKAIEEFAEKVISRYHELPTTLGYTNKIIREIAEQMKEAGE